MSGQPRSACEGMEVESCAASPPGLLGTSPEGGKPPNECAVPREIMETVDVFREFVQRQVGLSTQVASYSPEQMLKVTADIGNVKYQLTELTNGVAQQTYLFNYLKQEVARLRRDAEMALRTHLHPGDSAPLGYFQRLAACLEAELARDCDSIAAARRLLAQLSDPPEKLTPGEVHSALRSANSSFVFLAARAQALHVIAEKERQRYHDLRGASPEPRGPRSPEPCPQGTKRGPTPFPAIGTPLGFGFNSSSDANTSQIP
ncbi:uncharacterized protein LOC134527845 isoform X1 [Bacillus rossius redtenbacheri]|uniref:uncharacterized protein LOC134527845 isoform X1 n=1 Tax=Bacillus rossius redtenbacheri TaxID=93214 RepID=UPI002FDEE1DC